MLVFECVLAAHLIIHINNSCITHLFHLHLPLTTFFICVSFLLFFFSSSYLLFCFPLICCISLFFMMHLIGRWWHDEIQHNNNNNDNNKNSNRSTGGSTERETEQKKNRKKKRRKKSVMPEPCIETPLKIARLDRILHVVNATQCVCVCELFDDRHSNGSCKVNARATKHKNRRFERSDVVVVVAECNSNACIPSVMACVLDRSVGRPLRSGERCKN